MRLFDVLAELHSYVGKDGKYPCKRHFNSSATLILEQWKFNKENLEDLPEDNQRTITKELEWVKDYIKNYTN